MRFPSFRKMRQRVFCGAGGEGYGGPTSSTSIVSWLTGTTSPHTYYNRKPDMVLGSSMVPQVSTTNNNNKNNKANEAAAAQQQPTSSLSFLDSNFFDTFVIHCGTGGVATTEPQVDQAKEEKTNILNFYPDNTSTTPSSKANKSGSSSKGSSSKRKWQRPQILSKNKKRLSEAVGGVDENNHHRPPKRLPRRKLPVSEVQIDEKSHGVVSAITTPSVLLRLQPQRQSEKGEF